MGTIDSATITLTCPSCGKAESDRVLDKGSGWSGSHWQAPTFRQFDVTLTGNAKDEYVVAGTCPQCQVTATVAVQYGT
ncbi:hypothetical protein [Nocardioides albus]|uniref:Uncharacterized protein n=1 Tax=Nocardioides albus TaxID=1841 RepID=A0A7W5AAB2_9ACTN|nr:hypothetical protein [Nocardioides albus]MBB3092144.1 hypothetical protein [Nocardioides albus]